MSKGDISIAHREPVYSLKNKIMKHVLIFSLVCIFFTSCKNNTNDANDVFVDKSGYADDFVGSDWLETFLYKQSAQDFLADKRYDSISAIIFSCNVCRLNMIPADSVLLGNGIVMLKFREKVTEKDVAHQIKIRNLRPGNSKEFYTFKQEYKKQYCSKNIATLDSVAVCTGGLTNWQVIFSGGTSSFPMLESLWFLTYRD